MKKIVIAALISASVASSAFAADTKNFEGFSAGLNLNLITAGVKASGDGYSYDSFGGKATQSVAIDAAYGFKISPDSVLTIGIDYDLSDPKIYEVTGEGESLNFKQKSRYGVYIAPGYAVSKDALVYAKLGWNKLKAEGSTEGEGSLSESFSGYSFGIGTKVMLSNQMFVKVEATRQNYSSKTIDDVNFKPTATVGTIGLGMNF